MEAFERMKAEGLEPDRTTYNALISALEKGGQLPRALAVRGEMRQAGVQADTITYSALIR